MSNPARRMILATFIHNSGAHPGGWRYPGAEAVDQHDFRHYARLAQTAERGKLDYAKQVTTGSGWAGMTTLKK